MTNRTDKAAITQLQDEIRVLLKQKRALGGIIAEKSKQLGLLKVAVAAAEG